jgi:hypothetical protein
VKAAREHLRNARMNILNFLRRRLYQDFGLKELIERFYNSIRTGSDLPIPYREILLTARVMDEIFAQIYPDKVSNQAASTHRENARKRLQPSIH